MSELQEYITDDASSLDDVSGYDVDVNVTSSVDAVRSTITPLPLIVPVNTWTPAAIQRLVTLSVLIVVTLIGNVAIVSALTCCQPAVRYRTINRRAVNVFIVNLAVGDLTVCCFTMTTEVVFVVHGNNWVLGDTACRLIVYVQIVTLASTTFILTAMSIDRYLVVYHPLLIGSYRASKMISVAWLMASIVALPQIFIFRKTAVGVYQTSSDDVNSTTVAPFLYSGGDNVSYYVYACASKGYTAWWQRKTYFTAMSTYIFVLPTAIISFCYFNIVRAVWKHHSTPTATDATIISARSIAVCHSRSPSPRGAPILKVVRGGEPPGNSNDGGSYRRTRNDGLVDYRCVVIGGSRNSSPSQSCVSARAKMETLRITLSLVGVFIVCWTPYFVVHLVHIWSEYQRSIPQEIFALADTMALLNSAVNPLLYAVFTVRLSSSSSTGTRRQRRKQFQQPRLHQQQQQRTAAVAGAVCRATARPLECQLVAHDFTYYHETRQKQVTRQVITAQPTGLLQAGARVRAARTAAARRQHL